MDDGILSSFQSRIGQIEAYWDHLSIAARIGSLDASQRGVQVSDLIGTIGVALTPGLRKTLDYSSVIIALYGAVEEYVEHLLEHCIEILDRAFSKYSDLPAAFRKSHERLSIRLADQVIQSRYRGRLTLGVVAENLSSCLSNSTQFNLNKEAFSGHNANMRFNVVREMFSNISMGNIEQSIITNPEVDALMTSLGRLPKDIFYYLDDLADRRNVVAHGEQPQDVLSTQMMPEYFTVIRAFGQVLFESALIGMLDLTRPSNWVPLGLPTAVYSKGHVVCFEATSNFELSVGDRILWQVSNRWKTAQISSIEVDGNGVSSLISTSGVKFGVGFAANAHNKSDYWLVVSW